MYSTLRHLLFQFDAETIHHTALWGLGKTPLARILGPKPSEVSQPVQLWNLTFRNPIGLAAGMDKDGVAVAAWRDLGFGFIELGTVTRHPQPGNPRPRIFRCPQQKALINRMGFPNQGAEALANRLRHLRVNHHEFPVAINLGKSKVTTLEEAASDYLFSFETLDTLGDFFIVNVSSPNTPGLRNLQDKTALTPILKALQDSNRARHKKPILVKIAPDLTLPEISEILEVIADLDLAGIVATNTTLDHSSVTLQETGGLSGNPLRQKSTEIIRYISKETQGRLPIIGVGGVFTRDDYLEKRDAGASLVEVYTGFVYQGPSIVRNLLEPS
jgi:dihydroorotate dehydrogenase